MDTVMVVQGIMVVDGVEITLCITQPLCMSIEMLSITPMWIVPELAATDRIIVPVTMDRAVSDQCRMPVKK